MAADTPVDVDRLRNEIESTYQQVAERPDGSYHFHTGRRAMDHLGYPADLLDALPASAIDAFAGVANVFGPGLPEVGSRVVDVGSGAGTDTLIAARAVGTDGAAIGVDINEAMLQRARAAAAAAGMPHVGFRRGLAEELPVDDGWADLVISNGVLNLVPDKAAAYTEIHRALRPGGRLQVSDICVEAAVPDEAKQDVDLWTA
jgi:arsenite methyltransferase